MTAFKEGDVVMLKSGGPAMTVVERLPNGQVTCTWFEKGDRKHCLFKETLLQAVKRGGLRWRV